MQELLASAPKHDPEAVRVTFVTAFFWYRSDLAMEVVNQDERWKQAKLAFITQIGAWYYYCGSEAAKVLLRPFSPQKQVVTN